MTTQPADTDAVIILVDPEEVARRLDALSLSEDILRGAMWAGLLHSFRCTEHDPPSLPGLLAWGKTVRELRDKLVPLGWDRNDDENYSTVVRPDGQMAIAVAAGDSRTGQLKGSPSTRRAKGKVTRRAVNRNQLTFADIVESFPIPRSVGGLQTWLLLHFVDESAEEIRLELSLPRGMDDVGHVDLWRERIILESMRIIDVPLLSVDDDQPDNYGDIQVERRA